MKKAPCFVAKRILIVGDSGRGKSTLAHKLSEKLKIRNYSTDDFFWKVKFTVAVDKLVSVKNISKAYNQESWIVEGSTRSLVKEGIEKSEQIIQLVYPNLISQFWTLFKRNQERKDERLIDLLGLYKHLIMKRFKLGRQKEKESLEGMLQPYTSKIIRVTSFKEVNEFVDEL